MVSSVGVSAVTHSPRHALAVHSLHAADRTFPALPALQFNDFISSVRVPAGMTAVFWENNNYGGRGLRVTGPSDVPCFDNWRFSKVTSSMQISEWHGFGVYWCLRSMGAGDLVLFCRCALL